MRRFRFVLVPGALIACLWVGLSVSSQTQTGSSAGTGLRGRVTSADGKPLEGVAVSAKSIGSTMTTTVWTNLQGDYYFPALPDGRYRIWAQAVGFQLTRAEQPIGTGKGVLQNFTLPPYAEIWRQMDDIEWLDSMPEGLPEDRGIPGRMKRVLMYQCSTCHNSGFMLEKRFAAADWELLYDYMTMDSHQVDPPYDGSDTTYRARDTEYEDDMPGGGKFPTKMVDEEGRPIGAQRRVFAFYKKDVLSYLTRVRGPEPYPIQWKPLPRPRGDAANIVVTEYDLPNDGTVKRLDPKTGRMTTFTLNADGSTARNDKPTYYLNEHRTGSDWSRGARSQFQEISQHDIKVGRDGYVYLPGGGAGRALDPQGNLWFTGGGGAIRFNVKAETFTRFPLPKGWAGFHNGKDVDSQGNLWAATQAGAYRLNPRTGEWTLFPSKTPLGRQYGLTVDREDRAWFAQIAADKIGYVDGRTGDVGEVALPPVDDPMTPEDRALNPGWTFNQAIWQKGPRRLQADPTGDYVWASAFFGGYLERIHIRTKQLTEYKLPHPYKLGNTYEPSVGKNGMVYFSMSNADFVGAFNPRTEQFTFYPIPTRGHNARNIDVDNTPAIPEVWIPYSAAGKVARMQFRANPAR